MPTEDLILLGRKVGTCEGFDEIDRCVERYHRVRTIDKARIVLGTGPFDLVVDYLNGRMYQLNEAAQKVTDEPPLDMVENLITLESHT